MNKFTPVFLPILLILSACGLMSGDDAYPLILKDHVLAGKIWDVRKGRFIEKVQLKEGIRQSEFILLGETHDNPLHHEYQSWVINELYQSGSSALVAFEMINNAQGEVIKDKQYAATSDLIEDLNQVKTTWKYERRYKPVFDAILQSGFQIFPANLDRATIMGIAREGVEKIPPHLKLYLDKNILTEEQKNALQNEIKMSHCGMENPHMTKAMMLTQQVKDAEMANSLIRDTRVDKRILVAGSGHVRNDRGVPMYIRGEHGDSAIAVIAWVEVARELTEVNQYAERWGGSTMPFDYVWFTARTDRPDPCKSFRQHMEMKNKNTDKNTKQ